jgi:DNA polymerase/3'-5' exonuclease PolX
MDKLTKIYGIGPKLAEQYLKEGINGVKLDKDKPMRAQLKKKKIFPHLPAATQADLRWNPSRRIPHTTIKKIDHEFKKRLPGVRHQIAGSYRRKKPYSRDIDLIISAPSNRTTAKHWESFLKRMKKSDSVKFVEVFAQGEDKVSTILRYQDSRGSKRTFIKVDVFFTDPKEYMFMLLYATGSGSFNVRMRAVAKRKGYLLNQRGLYKKVSETILKRIPVKNEKHLFDILKIKYLEPEKRLK